MNDNLKYQQSISAQFLAIKDQVRYFIGTSHWGEDGRYKEVILINFLRRILPDYVGVGTGFVKNEQNELTNQIDIILYKKDDPTLFKEGDFIVLMPQSVLGIIEVKSNGTTGSLCSKSKRSNSISTIEKCHRNGKIIGNIEIFNGIFLYESKINISHETRVIQLFEQLNQNYGFINHICFGSNIFMRYWKDGNPLSEDDTPSYSYYDLSSRRINGNKSDAGFAFGYFISNLLETIYRQTRPDVLGKQYFEFLYPLEGTKETYRILDKPIGSQD